MKRILAILLLISVTCSISVVAQTEKRNDDQPRRFNYKRLTSDPNSEYYNYNIKKSKDNASERYSFEFNRLKNPKTGKIPENIKKLELEYVLSERSKLQLADEGGFFNFRNGLNFKTANGDQSSPWVNRGPFNVGGRTRALAIDLDDENIILAGGVSGGMWRTTNQGTTWTRVTSGSEHPTVTDVEQDPRSAFNDTWYYSTGERIGASQSARNGSAFLQGNGIYKSTDNGITWSVLTATQNNTPQSFDNAFDLIFNIEVNPVNGDLYVATFYGIFRSTDGGTSFTEVLSAEFDNFSDIHITSTGVIYAALDNDGGNGGIYRTTDGASGTWTNITDASFPSSYGRTVIHTAPSNENILYILASGTPSAPVGHDFWKYTYVSGDGSGSGGTWVNRSANLPNIGGSVGSFNSQGGYDLYVRVHPTNEDIVFIGGTNIYRSSDAFATSSGVWIGGYSPLNNVSLYTNHHPDQHSLEFFPSDPSKVITGHDGGISITDDIMAPVVGTEPVTWTSLNNGYLTTQVYALSIGPSDQLMAGFQDNSTWFTNNTNPADTWVDVFSGDGSYNAFDSDGTVRYLSSQRGNIYKVTYSDANSATPQSFTSLSPAEGLFVAPFELDPNNDEIMYYAASNTVWRNDNLSNATSSTGWTQLTNAASSSNVSTIGVSTQPANVVYFGTTSGEIYRIDGANTGNPSATDIFTSKGLPSGNVSSINVNPYNADDVIVTFSNYSIRSIFQTLNGGTSWTNISGNLEENTDGTGNGPSVRWASRIGNNDRYFIGTSTGLYSATSLNGTSTIWTQENMEGISNAVVEQIRVRNTDGLVVVGTHGNGLFSANYEVSQADVIVENPLSDITTSANSSDIVLDVSNIFKSNTDPIQTITVTVDNNSNPSLLSAGISGNNLTISLIADQYGTAEISLRGTDGSGEFGTSAFNVFVTPPPVSSFPYTVDFESNLPDGWNTSGDMDWIIASSGTPSPGTGPLVDHTFGNSTGQFIFSESSDPVVQDDEAILTSREIDLSTLTNPRLQFFYHMFGESMGSLKVIVNDITNSSTTEVFSVTGQQQQNQDDDYLSPGPTGIDLSSFNSSVVTIDFIAVKGTNFTSDVAIDDIEFFELPGNDVGVVDVSVSNQPFYGADETVTAAIVNYGGNSQSSFDVTYILDGGTPVTETVSATIASGDTLYYDFSIKLDASSLSTFNVEAYTSLTGDVDASNDATTNLFIKATLINSFPYYSESFESGTNNWYTAGVNNSWELGAPNATTINSASDGSNAWVTNLTGAYSNSTDAQVYSPYFDLSTYEKPVVQLDIWAQSEIDWDGTVLEATYNRGQDWLVVGNFGDPDNWYNNDEIESLGGGPGWDDTDGSGWVTATKALPLFAINPEVAFRVRFVSDGSFTDEGFAFDNFKVFDLLLGLDLSSSRNTTNIPLEITPFENVIYYRMDVSTDGFNTFLPGYQNIQLFNPSINITGLQPDTEYNVRIKSYVTDAYSSDYFEFIVRTMALPVATAASNITTLSFTANWEVYTEYLGADSYKLEVSDDNFVTNLAGYDMVDIVPNSLDVTGLTEGTEYQYRVSAVVNGELTDPSESISVTTLTSPPSAPDNLQISVINSNSLSLSWNDNSTNEDGFVVERKLASASNFEEVTTVPTDNTSYTDSGLDANTAYIYRVYSTNTAGNSAYSNESEALTLADAPTALAATEVLENSFVANWSNTGSGLTYQLDVSTDNFVTTLAGYNALELSETSKSIEGLEENTQYQYRVKTVNASGNSLASNIIEVTTLKTLPTAPTQLTISVGYNFTNLEWTDNADNEESYTIERKLSSQSNFSEVSSLGENISSYQDTDVEFNTEYIYRVYASNSRGVSDYSNEFTVQTLPEIPSALNATDIAENSFIANWSDQGEGVSYAIDVSDDNFETTLENYTTKTISSGNSTLVEGLDEFTVYKYRVRSENSTGYTDFSNIIELTTLKSFPLAPSNLSLSETEEGIVLSWDDESFNESSFVIQKKLSSNDEFVDLVNLSANTSSFIDDQISFNTSYTYQVFAVNSRGNSNAIEGTISTLPNAPTATEATSLSINSFTANWTGEGAGLTYLVDVSEDDFASTLEGYNALEVDALSVDVTGLDDLKSYAYRVRAMNASGSSNYSNTIEATTLLDVPEAPSDLAFELVDAEILLSWSDNSTSETAFIIERKIGGSEFVELATVETDITTYLDEIGAVQENVTYRVFSENSSGKSEASNEITVGVEVTSNKAKKIASQISVLPNPSTGRFSIQWQKKIEIKSIKIVDLSGKEILLKQLNAFNDNFNIDLSEYESAVYLLVMETQDGFQIMKKLIKK
jgi:hypothetical protein